MSIASIYTCYLAHFFIISFCRLVPCYLVYIFKVRDNQSAMTDTSNDIPVAVDVHDHMVACIAELKQTNENLANLIAEMKADREALEAQLIAYTADVYEPPRVPRARRRRMRNTGHWSNCYIS